MEWPLEARTDKNQAGVIPGVGDILQGVCHGKINNRHRTEISAHEHMVQRRFNLRLPDYFCLIRKTDGVSVSSLVLSGWLCAHECVFDRRNCRRRFVHTLAAGGRRCCQDAKSFLVSNLAPAPLRVPALSHSFIYISFLIRSRPGGDAAPPPHPCQERERILSPDCVPDSSFRMSGPTQKQKERPNVCVQPAVVGGLLRWE